MKRRKRKTNLHFGVLALGLHVLNLLLDPFTKFRQTNDTHKSRISPPSFLYSLLVLTRPLSILSPLIEKEKKDFQGGGGGLVHFLLDELQPRVHGQHGLAPDLFQEHGTDKFVNVRGGVEGGKLLIVICEDIATRRRPKAGGRGRACRKGKM